MSSWIIAAIGLGVAAAIIAATVLMVRRRKRMRALAEEAEGHRVVSTDTIRAGWYSGAHRSHGDADGSDGGGDSGGGSD